MQNEFNLAIPIHSMKSVDIREETEDAWIFEGIASTSDVDLFDEVVYPESFLKTIDFFQEKGKIYFDHEYAKKNEEWLQNHGFTKEEIISLKTPIGKPTEARVTDEGLYIKGVLNKKHPMAKLMWEQYLNNEDKMFNDQIGLSIGAKYLGQPRREYDVHKGKYVTFLPDLLLYEVSMTPEPVNPYTKTWASVLKSMIAEAESTENVTPNYHNITPDSVIFDPERNQLAIKSTVEGSDGVIHVFESYIDVKEDVRKAMADNKEKEELTMDVSAEEETPEVETEATPEAEAGALEGVGEEVPAEEGGEEAPMDDMAEEGAEMAGGLDIGGEGGEDADAGGVLDSLVEGAEGEAGEPEVGEPQADESTELMLDKLDTVLDAVMQIADALHEETPVSETPGEGQVTTDQLMKSITSEGYKTVLKSIVEEVVSEQDQTVSLSQESTESFGRAIKSLFDGFEDRVVEKVVRKLTEETVVSQEVMKSTSSAAKTEEVVSPGVAVDNSKGEEIEADVRKSVLDEETPEINPEVLKSLTNKYLAISGYTPDAAQKKAALITRAESELGLTAPEFRYYVNKAYKESK